MPPLVVDADIPSAVMRRHEPILTKAQSYLAEHGRFTLSVITQYEVLRGLQAKRAQRQIETFGIFCSHSRLLPLTSVVVDRAAEIYADLHGRGQFSGDADAACPWGELLVSSDVDGQDTRR